MQRLLNIYYHCCYQGHWNELCKVLNYFLETPRHADTDILINCVKGAHQYCISATAINSAVAALANAKVLYKKYVDFEDLYDDVRFNISSIPGIGELTIYDTALRIGFISYPIILPREYVYLSRGAMDGAKNLFGSTTSLKFREPTKKFVPFFGNLSSHFIEDFLCVLKDYICFNGNLGATPIIPPDPSICKCTCSLKFQIGQGVCNSQHNNPKDGCFCFCERIRQKDGNLKIEYADDGEQNL